MKIVQTIVQDSPEEKGNDPAYFDYLKKNYIEEYDLWESYDLSVDRTVCNPNNNVNCSKHSGLIYGTYFVGRAKPILLIDEDDFEVIIRGETSEIEVCEISLGRCYLRFMITDDSGGSVPVQLFLQKDEAEKLESKLKRTKSIRVSGTVCSDKHGFGMIIGLVYGIKKGRLLRKQTARL